VFCTAGEANSRMVLQPARLVRSLMPVRETEYECTLSEDRCKTDFSRRARLGRSEIVSLRGCSEGLDPCMPLLLGKKPERGRQVHTWGSVWGEGFDRSCQGLTLKCHGWRGREDALEVIWRGKGRRPVLRSCSQVKLVRTRMGCELSTVAVQHALPFSGKRLDSGHLREREREVGLGGGFTHALRRKPCVYPHHPIRR
jgi:hypothetical protein